MITTLVLGAGVSQDFGYPSGLQLVDLIKRKLDDDLELDILRDLQTYNGESIDAFIGDHPEYTSYLKAIIAEIIYSKEDVDALFRPNSFYAFFFNKIRPEHFNKFRIITFNYDRSLEEYCYQNTFRKLKDHTKAIEAMSQLKITHIHGRLSGLPHEPRPTNTQTVLGYGDYNRLTDANRFAQISDMRGPAAVQEQQMVLGIREGVKAYGQAAFKFIHENKNLNESAIEMLNESSRIIFLGNSYHSMNLELLGFKKESPVYPKAQVHGTGFGLKPIKKDKVSKYGIKIGDWKAVEFFENDVDLEEWI